MRVRSPLMSIDARGAMGPGVVLGKYRGTNTGRMRIRTPIRRSSKEQNVRNNLAMGAGAWGLLSSDDRQGWNDYAETIDRINVFGEIYHAAGQAEYLANYSITRMIETPAPTSAPGVKNPGMINNFTAAWNNYLNIVSLKWSYKGDFEKIELFFTPVLSYGRMSIISGELYLHEIVDAVDEVYEGKSLYGQEKVIFKARGLKDNGQWGTFINGIVPPGYPI